MIENLYIEINFKSSGDRLELPVSINMEEVKKQYEEEFKQECDYSAVEFLSFQHSETIGRAGSLTVISEGMYYVFDTSDISYIVVYSK